MTIDIIQRGSGIQSYKETKMSTLPKEVNKVEGWPEVRAGDWHQHSEGSHPQSCWSVGLGRSC